MGRTEISVSALHYRNFCTPRYRNFCVKQMKQAIVGLVDVRINASDKDLPVRKMPSFKILKADLGTLCTLSKCR